MNGSIVERLRDEADLCRNEGADDIAVLLDEAADTIEELAGAASALAYAEAEYRLQHDTKGGGHIDTGRAWDRMRYAGKRVTAALAKVNGEGA